MGWFSEFDLGMGCWISDIPDGCSQDPDVTCTGVLIAWCFAGIWLLLLFFSIIINNIVIFRFVRRTTKVGLKKSFEHNNAATDIAANGIHTGTGNGTNNGQSKEDKRVNAVASQALFSSLSL